jgi:hypothetical protein
MPKDDEERAFVGPAIYEVAFQVGNGRQAGSVTTPYGKILWIPEELC